MKTNRNYTEITKNVLMLHEPMFPLYLVRGKENILMDTAISAVTQSVSDKLGTLLQGETLHSVLLTHSHYDHTGALPFLQKKFGCRVIGSPRTIELLKKQEVRDFIADMNTRFNKVLGSGVTTEFPELNHLYSVREGEKVRVDSKRYFVVLETPGHTRCSISFLLMPDRILFPGDAAGVLEKNGKVKPLFLSSYNSYIESIGKLIDLKAEMLCPPHNTRIKGAVRVQKHLRQALEAAINLKEKIVDALKSGMSIKETTKIVMEKEFPLPVVQGPQKAFDINLTSMVRTVSREAGISSSEK